MNILSRLLAYLRSWLARSGQLPDIDPFDLEPDVREVDCDTSISIMRQETSWLIGVPDGQRIRFMCIPYVPDADASFRLPTGERVILCMVQAPIVFEDVRKS